MRQRISPTLCTDNKHVETEKYKHSIRTIKKMKYLSIKGTKHAQDRSGSISAKTLMKNKDDLKK